MRTVVKLDGTEIYYLLAGATYNDALKHAWMWENEHEEEEEFGATDKS